MKERETIWNLLRTAHRVNRHITFVLGSYRLRAASYAILDYLQRQDEQTSTITKIKTGLHAAMPDLTRMIDRLEALGYVARRRSSQDRRSIFVHLTPEGLAAYEGATDTLSGEYKRIAIREGLAEVDGNATARGQA